MNQNLDSQSIKFGPVPNKTGDFPRQTASIYPTAEIVEWFQDLTKTKKMKTRRKVCIISYHSQLSEIL